MQNKIESLEDVVNLCKFAIDATGTSDEYAKGMCAGFEYVIDCIIDDGNYRLVD